MMAEVIVGLKIGGFVNLFFRVLRLALGLVLEFTLHDIKFQKNFLFFLGLARLPGTLLHKFIAVIYSLGHLVIL